MCAKLISSKYTTDYKLKKNKDHHDLDAKKICRCTILYMHDTGTGYKDICTDDPIQGNINKLKEIAKKIEHSDRVKNVYITRIV